MANVTRRRHHPYGNKLWGPDFANQKSLAATSVAADAHLVLGEQFTPNERAGHVVKRLCWRNGSGTSARVFIGGIQPNATWGAGQWTDATQTYTDDTADAQSTAPNDFALGGIINDGFIVHSDRPFTALILQTATVHAGITHTIEYLDGAAFVALPVLVAPTIIGDTAGQQLVIWSEPPSWDTSTGGGAGIPNGRHVIRVTYSGAAAGTADLMNIGTWRWAALDVPNASTLMANALDLALTSDDERILCMFDNGPVAGHEVSLTTELVSSAGRIGG